MPRKPAFSAASLYVHFQPTMTRAFPVLDDLPVAMRECLARLARPAELSLSERLAGLQRVSEDDSVGFVRAQ